MDRQRNQVDQERNKLHLTIGNQSTQDGRESPNQRISEIQDIYDSIYGIVQSKLEFYENKQGKSSSRPNTPVKNVSYDYTAKTEENLEKRHSEENLNTFNSKLEVSDSDESMVDVTLAISTVQEKPSTPPTPAIRRNLMEAVSNPDLLSNCSLQCTKCESDNFNNDRHEALTEMNANLKVEVEYLKQDLKKEIEKNNQLNFEIANIETALELYYKESQHQKSTISAIYSTMRNYSSNKNEDQTRYTYKRIKAIADYVDTLKVKLQHQDRIIKDNFLDNPYSTDMMMKYESARQQLDKLSNDNEELKDEIKKRQEEEIEIIKELNRQKFKVEVKSRETENYYKNELASKDIVIANLHDQHTKELKEIQDALEKNIEDMSKLTAIYEAKISNYKEELLIIYRKLKSASNEGI